MYSTTDSAVRNICYLTNNDDSATLQPKRSKKRHQLKDYRHLATKLRAAPLSPHDIRRVEHLLRLKAHHQKKKNLIERRADNDDTNHDNSIIYRTIYRLACLVSLLAIPPLFSTFSNSSSLRLSVTSSFTIRLWTFVAPYQLIVVITTIRLRFRHDATDVRVHIDEIAMVVDDEGG